MHLCNRIRVIRNQTTLGHNSIAYALPLDLHSSLIYSVTYIYDFFLAGGKGGLKEIFNNIFVLLLSYRFFFFFFIVYNELVNLLNFSSVCTTINEMKFQNILNKIL